MQKQDDIKKPENTLERKFANTLKASRSLPLLKKEQMNAVLEDLADTILENSDKILKANSLDLSRMDQNDPKYDRLLLNKERLNGIADDIRNVASLDCPIGEILEERKLENGLKLEKIRVPLGVIGIIYEARPNVTFDVFSLCFKSGNACILKGGSDAKESNTEAVKLIQKVLKKHGINTDICLLLPPERKHVKTLLAAKKYVDTIIPRGSQGLIDFVTTNSAVPVIETGAGICHTYVDKDADLKKATEIIFNAKTRRVSVCNALDCLIIHESLLPKLDELTIKLEEKAVEIFADQSAFEALKGKYPKLSPAKNEHFGTEFLSHKMSIKTVSNVEDAVEHITKYSSKHSEAIVTEAEETAKYFLQNVDAAAVYHNASTAFTDGAQFGLGAEIGISTQKLHARGPMSLREISSYKWIIHGKGQTRD